MCLCGLVGSKVGWCQDPRVLFYMCILFGSMWSSFCQTYLNHKIWRIIEAVALVPVSLPDSPMCSLRSQIKWGRVFVQICLAQCLPLQYSPSSLLFPCPFIWFFSVAPCWSVPPCIKTDALITENHQQTTSAVAWSSASKAQRRLNTVFLLL